MAKQAVPTGALEHLLPADGAFRLQHLLLALGARARVQAQRLRHCAPGALLRGRECRGVLRGPGGAEGSRGAAAERSEERFKPPRGSGPCQHPNTRCQAAGAGTGLAAMQFPMSLE